MRFVFAGDRDIAVAVLQFILQKGHRPLAMLLTDGESSTHANALLELVPELPERHIIYGKKFGEAENIALLQSLNLDYIIGIHYPYLIKKEVLNIPKIGFLNLHPAYLPYNKGWHTPSWAILEGTPFGATLHFMAEALDAGDIIHQKAITVLPNDTANSLYARVKKTEQEVFEEAWSGLLTLNPPRKQQIEGEGTSHKAKELLADKVQKLNLSENRPVSEVINQIRALTTNRLSEAVWFEQEGKRYRVQITITPENEQ